MSIFEIIMLICFGASWPFSIAKTYKFKTSGTKSYLFLWLVVIGYVSGIIHKYCYSWDWVVALYILDASMVATDMFLCYYYDWKNRRNSVTESSVENAG